MDEVLQPRKFLPDNLICLDLLAGPFYLEHPRKKAHLTYIVSVCERTQPHNVWIYYHWSDGPSGPFFPDKPHLSLLSNWPGFPQVTLLTFATLENSQMHRTDHRLIVWQSKTDIEGLFGEQCPAREAPSCLLLTY